MTNAIKFTMIVIVVMKIKKLNLLFLLFLILLMTSFINKQNLVYAFELHAKGIYFKENKQNIQTLGPFRITHDLWNIKSKSGTLNTQNQYVIAKNVSAIHPEVLIWSNQFTFFTDKNHATLQTPSISSWRGYQIEANQMHIDFSKNNLIFKKGVVMTEKENTLECKNMAINLDQSILIANHAKLSLQLETL